MGNCAFARAVVVTDTLKGAGTPALTCSGEVETIQRAAVGAPEHCSATAPENPPVGITCRLYCAVCPALTVDVVEPPEPASTEKGALPFPESESFCGVSGALSTMFKVAVRDAVPVGLKVTVIVQLADAASVAPQSCDSLKSAAFDPVTEIPVPENDSTAKPEFVRVTILGTLESPTAVSGNGRLPGISVTPGTGGTPLPLRATVCGLPGALSAIDRVACRVPVSAGLNVTLIVQLNPTPRTAGQVFCSVNSVLLVPETVMPLLPMANPSFPTFVNWTGLGPFGVLRTTSPKDSAVGATSATGPDTG